MSGFVCGPGVVSSYMFMLMGGVGFCVQVVVMCHVPCTCIGLTCSYCQSSVLKKPQFAHGHTGFWLLNLNDVSSTWFNT